LARLPRPRPIVKLIGDYQFFSLLNTFNKILDVSAENQLVITDPDLDPASEMNIYGSGSESSILDEYGSGFRFF